MALGLTVALVLLGAVFAHAGREARR